MKLNELVKTTERSKKRPGRGLGSGKGKTGGRGTKGQKARGTIPAGFVGALPLYKKLPYLKGFHRDGIHSSSSLSKKMRVLHLSDLDSFKANSEITMDTLLEENIISKRDVKSGVKILSGGELKVSLIVKLPVSKSAKESIEASGGKVE
jgi:large subunit ribosomal protein L15